MYDSCNLKVECEAVLLYEVLHQDGSGVMQRAMAAVQGALSRVLDYGEISADVGFDLPSNVNIQR